LTAGVVRTYDNLDRLTSETTSTGSVAYTYDAAGRRTAMTVSGQTGATYSYDDADRLTSITQGSAVVQFGYDDANRRDTLTLPNGITTSYSYDDASQLTSIAYALGASSVGDLNYSYDRAGRRTAVTGSLARTELPGPTSSTAYDAANRLTEWNGAALSYDDNGNLLSDGARTYIWDARNRLVGISGAVSAAFTYDAVGRRLSKIVNGANLEFVYDGLNPVQERSGGAAVANLMTGSGIDEFFRRTDAAGARDFLTDALGSTLALTDTAGAIRTSYAYDPYGNVAMTADPSTNSYQYTGRENDGTGLYYYRARFYSPELKRFISEDPIGIDGGLNFYQYVAGDPVNFNDPLGLVLIGTIGPAMGLSLEESAQISGVGNAAMGVVAAGAPVVAMCTIAAAVGANAAANLTAQQLRDLAVAGLIAASKNPTIANKAPSLPTQSPPAVQRLLEQIKKQSKTQSPGATQKLP
jgi:RHS repeat-associated protein